MNRRLKRILKVVLPLAFGLLILWLLYRHMDMQALLSTMRSDARFGVIFLGCLFGTLGNTIRGLRWQLLNRTLDPEVSCINSILTTHGNYGVSLALPRVGEVWRVATMSHYSGIGFGRLLGTLFVDRIFDVIVLVVLVLLGLLVNAPFFSEFITANPRIVAWWGKVITSPWFYLVIAILIGSLVALVLWVKRSGRGRHLVKNVIEGLRTLQTMSHKGLFYLYTVGIWAGYFLQFYICFWAFSFTQGLGFSAGLLSFVMASVGVLVPTQGGMGGWHFMVIYTLMAYGVESADAQSFALIVHTCQAILWTGFVGLLSMALLPVVNRNRNIVNE